MDDQESVLKKKSCADKVDDDDCFAGEFPTGLKILIVDDDRTCLVVLERMLRKLYFEVTKCQLARDALALLREDKKRFDIVICDLHMPEMDGLKLLQIINGLEMDVPVVMMSSDDENRVVMKGIIHGACDYLVKPVRMEAVRFIWQHVIRKRKQAQAQAQQAGNINVNGNNKLSLSSDQQGNNKTDAADQSVLLPPARDINKGSSVQSLKQTREDEDEDDGTDQSSDEATAAKKPRMIWTQELHEMFVAAISELGHDKAVPKRILERMQAMNVTGLTRANIASHLQKYRMHLQKVGESSSGKRDINAMFEQASMFRQRNIRAHPASGTSCHHRHLPLQTLMAQQSLASLDVANGNVSVDLHHHHHHQGRSINAFDSIISEPCRSLPTHDYSGLHDLPGGSNSTVALMNNEYLYRTATDQLSDPGLSSAVDHELIYDPSFYRQFYQADIFGGGPLV